MTEDTNVVPSGEGDSDEDDGDGDEDHGDGTADELAEDLEEASYTLVRDIVDAVFPDMNEKIKPVIDKARRICKFYRWDLKNQTLQSEIAREQQVKYYSKGKDYAAHISVPCISGNANTKTITF